MPRRILRFTAAERRAIGGYATVIVLLHIIGWGLCLLYAGSHPALLGLGLSAYLFGLRHAFDADHIAAVDDTVRLMLQKGRMPHGVGFFFSLGHSTVVLLLVTITASLAAAVNHHMGGLETIGDVIGPLVSGIFLCIIGALNVTTLFDMLHVWNGRHARHAHVQLDELVAGRGLLHRVFGTHLTKLIDRSWKMYPVGLLFGLGFDTASEIALLALAGGAAERHIAFWVIFSLPILFTAGMSLMDTADGILMTHAYGWALFNPIRRMFYNLLMTSLSVAVALMIGLIELTQAIIAELRLHGSLANDIAGLSFATFGYIIVAMFLLTWIASYFVSRTKRLRQLI